MFVIPMECIFFGYTFLVILNYFKNHWLYFCLLYLKFKYNQKAGITKKSRYNKKKWRYNKKKPLVQASIWNIARLFFVFTLFSSFIIFCDHKLQFFTVSYFFFTYFLRKKTSFWPVFGNKWGFMKLQLLSFTNFRNFSLFLL